MRKGGNSKLSSHWITRTSRETKPITNEERNTFSEKLSFHRSFEKGAVKKRKKKSLGVLPSITVLAKKAG